MMIYVSIILGVLALMALAILVKLSSILLEHVDDGMMRQVMYVTISLQAVDHKVSKASGVKDGEKDYIDELVKKEYDKMEREEHKDK